MITAIGIGPGDPAYMTRQGEALLAAAEVVTGFETILKLADELIPSGAERVALTYRNQEEKLAEVAEHHAAGRYCAVLFMGDIGFSGFQLLERIERACGERIDYVPGISAAQMVAAAGRVCFDETAFITFHRRGDLAPFKQRLVSTLKEGWNAIVIPHPWDFMPHNIAGYLVEAGISGEQPLEVWEDLTRTDRQWQGYLADCPTDFSDMSIMLIRTTTPITSAV